MKLMKRLWLLFLPLILACSDNKKSEVNEEEKRWENHAKHVEIIRDDFGVPHIYGKTDANAVFGLLYAQCEDDFNRVEQNYIWATGRLAEVEGEKALYSDLRANLFMTEIEAIERYEKAPDWLKDLCVAFADGINYYLETHPEVQPKLITHFEPWMPMYFSEGSIGGDIERISTQKIKAFYESGAPEVAMQPVHDGLLRLSDNEPRGSNGFALSGQKTASGNAMLLINPHTSFFFRGEVHVVSEEGLNAYGAVTWGQFFVYQGFNEKTGWMHTSTYTDILDEFTETVETDKNGKVYAYGEERRPVDSVQIELKYKEGTTIKTKPFTMYRTHHGPVTHSQAGKWVSTAMMWDPVNALVQSYTRTKLADHKAFRDMMDIRTNSSNNTVYADAEGNIAYYHGNFIPKRDTTFDYTNPVDGSNPATDWQGLHDVADNITVINPSNGWIQNCNSTPFTSAGASSPKAKDYPKYMSENIENFRGVHAIRLLEKASDLTLDGLIKLAYDPYLPAFETSIPGLIHAFNQHTDSHKTLTEPMEILEGWDFSVSKESKAMTLAHFYTIHYLRNGEFPEGLSFMERVEYLAQVSDPIERLEMFQATLKSLQEDYGSWNLAWGEVNRYQRINGDIRQPFDDAATSLPVGLASGRWGALASFGARRYNGTKKLYGTSGNSFVAVVEFGDKVHAKSMLAGGQSGDPTSKHFSDQAQRYVDVQFKEVAYYKEDVEKRAQKRYHPGAQIEKK